MKGTLNINIRNYELKFGSTINDLAERIQQSSDKIIAVVDGEYLHYYEPGQNPENLFFIKKIIPDKIPHYYFQDVDTLRRYCVFGKKWAKLFCSSLEKNRIIKPIENHDTQSIIIYDGDSVFKFKKSSCELEIETHQPK